MPKSPTHQTKQEQIFLQLLREIRTDARLSQVQLAERLNRPQSYVSKIESGERKAEWLEVREIVEACGSNIFTLDVRLDVAIKNSQRAKRQQQS